MTINELNIKRIAGLALGLCVIAAALLLLHRHTEHITFAMVLYAAEETAYWKILFSALATLISFAGMAASEIVAVKTTHLKTVPWRISILAGAVGNALGNTLGFHALTISAWRYKIYAAAGLRVIDVARITGGAFLGVAFGFIGVTAYALLLDPTAVVGGRLRYAVGLALLLLIASFLIWSGSKAREICFRSHSITLPRLETGLLQCVIGIADLSAAIYAAYILLPPDIAPSFLHFSVFYVGAVLFGIASHTPGGVGVFEAGIMTALAAEGRADVLAALLLYRVIYNLMPFGIACLAIAIHTLRSRPSVR